MEKQNINNSKATIQIYERSLAKLFTLRNSDSETIASVIDRILSDGKNLNYETAPVAISNDSQEDLLPVKKFAKRIGHFRQEKIITDESNGKYCIILFGTYFYAQKSLGELYAKFIEIFADIAPDAIEKIRDKTTPKDSRSYLTWDKNRVFISSPHLFTDHHKLTSVGYIPTNIGKNEAEGYLKTICEAAEIEYGKDMIWIKGR